MIMESMPTLYLMLALFLMTLLHLVVVAREVVYRPRSDLKLALTYSHIAIMPILGDS